MYFQLVFIFITGATRDSFLMHFITLASLEGSPRHPQMQEQYRYIQCYSDKQIL